MKNLSITQKLWRWIYSSGVNYELTIKARVLVLKEATNHPLSIELQLAMDCLDEILDNMQKGARELNLDYRNDEEE